jgi:RHS repeat-associated protein
VLAAAARGGTTDSPITWVFEPESFAPLAKLVGDSRYAIVTDHLGTPQAMFDATGAEVWSASIDAYGDLRDIRGDRQSCPFRYPGQYEDQETGLYYNRFRYYDANAGAYASRDRLKYHASIRSYGYVGDPGAQLDPFGLSACTVNDRRVGYDANLELHRDLFRREGGGSWVMTRDQYESYVMGRPMTGDPSGQFISTKARMDSIFQQSRGDLAHVEKSLGFTPGHFSDGGGLVRIDVPSNSMTNFRIPSGLERGANEHFRYGGYTSGGAPEAVINPVPTSQTVATFVGL